MPPIASSISLVAPTRAAKTRIQRGYRALLLASIIVLTSASCTTLDVAKGVWVVSENTYKGHKLYSETELFMDHWEMLNEKKVHSAAALDDAVIRQLEKDLQRIADRVSREFKPLIETNPTLQAQLYANRYPRPRIRIQKADRFFAYAEQGQREQTVVISSGLLVRNVNEFGQRILAGKQEWRRAHSGASEDDVRITEEVSIPGALEYKDSLIFVIAHESVHLLFDPPLKNGEQSREIEIRADALGLVLTAKSSFLVQAKQRTFGVTNLYLIVNSGGGDSMYSPVGYARFGPELLFEIHKEPFEPGVDQIYESVEDRISASKTYMDSVVASNVHTDLGTWMSFILSSVRQK